MGRSVTAVVLAAGRSLRMGREKLTLEVHGVPMILRVLDACAPFPTVVVTSHDLAASPLLAGITTIVNDDPERGMSRSLALADRAVDASAAVLVFLADKPLVTRELALDVVEAALRAQADVCYPVHEGVGGHPVFFSPAARARIAALPDGDTIARLRDDPQLRRATFETAEPGAFHDIDEPGALTRIHE